MPVTSAKMAAATSDKRSRPWTARSIRLATANSTHTHQTMIPVTERNTCGPPVASARLLRPTGTVPIHPGYPPRAKGPPAPTGLTSEERARREGGALRAARRRAGKQSERDQQSAGRALPAGHAGEGLSDHRAVVPERVDRGGDHRLDTDPDGPFVHVEGRLV